MDINTQERLIKLIRMGESNNGDQDESISRGCIGGERKRCL